MYAVSYCLIRRQGVHVTCVWTKKIRTMAVISVSDCFLKQKRQPHKQTNKENHLRLSSAHTQPHIYYILPPPCPDHAHSSNPMTASLTFFFWTIVQSNFRVFRTCPVDKMLSIAPSILQSGQKDSLVASPLKFSTVTVAELSFYSHPCQRSG